MPNHHNNTPCVAGLWGGDVRYKAGIRRSRSQGCPVMALALALAYNLDLSLDFRINIDHVVWAGGPPHFCVLVDA